LLTGGFFPFTLGEVHTAFDPLSERYEMEQMPRGLVSRAAQAFGVILLLGIAVADYLTGTEISFTCFYLVPILVVTWFSGRRHGVAMAVLSALIWPVAYVFGLENSSGIWVVLWNALNRLVVLLAFAWLASFVNRPR
jgi:hypothetical protein